MAFQQHPTVTVSVTDADREGIEAAASAGSATQPTNGQGVGGGGGIVVFSGGTAANSLVDVFAELASRRSASSPASTSASTGNDSISATANISTSPSSFSPSSSATAAISTSTPSSTSSPVATPPTPLSYVIPISDNGGSTSEIIRVFGGPGIGDIRSRLIRLIPKSNENIYNLLNHRLAADSDAALRDWQAIVGGSSPLWDPIPGPQRELLRSMLNHVNFEILKRARPPSNTFDLSTASVGNLFLTGARLFTGSFESAIYLLAIVGAIPSSVAVIPAITSNFAHHISAELASGEVIVGQNAISHPSVPAAMPGWNTSVDSPEDANLPGSLPSLRQGNITFTKAQEADLPSPIKRIWYINPYGQEMSVAVNPKVRHVLQDASAVIYSIGSLYTSILPCLVLRGVGEALARLPPSQCKKVLILNGSLDRESGPSERPMTAVDFVAAIARACEQSRGNYDEEDEKEEDEGPRGTDCWKRYVTHVIYIEGDGVPKVDKAALNAAGIDTVRCWSDKTKTKTKTKTKMETKKSNSSSNGDGGSNRSHGSNGSSNSSNLRYDEKGLLLALEAVLGKGASRALSRRNTIITH